MRGYIEYFTDVVPTTICFLDKFQGEMGTGIEKEQLFPVFSEFSGNYTSFLWYMPMCMKFGG